LTDEKALNIIRERATEQIKIAGDIMNNKKAEIDSMENLMHEISTKYGITDFEYQVNGFSREYYHALGSGGVNAKMETDRKNFEEKGVEFVSLKEQLLNLRLAYVKYQEKYQFIEMDLHKKLSFHNTVSKAVPPQRKDSPKRTLIIFLFTISVLFFAVIYIIYTEYYKAKFVNEFKDVH
jgi:LPS O-antigen subunit length determinant protein (WzzB/FepE family)